METTEYIRIRIDRIPEGHIFSYSDFMESLPAKEAIIKALNRMAASGKIAKLSKGKYYKPENTPFGVLLPDQYQIVKDVLEENGKIVGYLTGYSIYNHLGLTTQISNTIQIGKNKVRASFTRERYRITLIRQNNVITKDNIPLLQILDAIRFIKKIPDCTTESACWRLLWLIKNLSPNDRRVMARLALKYAPATRALTAALLETVTEAGTTDALMKSLNPITQYSFPEVGKVLPNTLKWQIK